MRPPYNRRADTRAVAAAALYLVFIVSLVVLSVMAPRSWVTP